MQKVGKKKNVTWPLQLIFECCIYNETKEEHNINTTVSTTIDNDVEQASEYGRIWLHLHGDVEETEVKSL